MKKTILFYVFLFFVGAAFCASALWVGLDMHLPRAEAHEEHAEAAHNAHEALEKKYSRNSTKTSEKPVRTLSGREKSLENEPQYITEEEFELLAALVWAEAGDQDEIGKRLVVDTVLNRVDSDNAYFPDDIFSVVYQPYQFSPVLDGQLDRGFYNADSSCYEAVKAELERRLDYDVLFFNAIGFLEGTPAFIHGDHYFSY